MFLKSRLRRLETKTGPPRCPACGMLPDSGGLIVYADQRPEVDPSERCGGCGRRLWFVIEVAGQDGTRPMIAVEDAGEGA